MANIAATDITVTIVSNEIMAPTPKRRVVAKLVFGDGALTYAAGGVPISKAKLLCPNSIESLTVFDSGTSGYKWTYDRANSKLVAIQGDNDAVADGPGNQPSTVAIAAQTLNVTVVGY